MTAAAVEGRPSDDAERQLSAASLTYTRTQSVSSIVVNQHPNLQRLEFYRLKAILHQCVVQGLAAQNREAKPHWREYLHGRVAWAAQLNPAKAQRLKRLLDQIGWSR